MGRSHWHGAFPFGGYRLLSDIICDLDDRARNLTRIQQLQHKTGDSRYLEILMDGLTDRRYYTDVIAERCRWCMSPPEEKRRMNLDEAAICAMALGSRQFVVDVMPAMALQLAKPYPGKKERRKWGGSAMLNEWDEFL